MIFQYICDLLFPVGYTRISINTVFACDVMTYVFVVITDNVVIFIIVKLVCG